MTIWWPLLYWSYNCYLMSDVFIRQQSVFILFGIKVVHTYPKRQAFMKYVLQYVQEMLLRKHVNVNNCIIYGTYHLISSDGIGILYHEDHWLSFILSIKLWVYLSLHVLNMNDRLFLSTWTCMHGHLAKELLWSVIYCVTLWMHDRWHLLRR